MSTSTANATDITPSRLRFRVLAVILILALGLLLYGYTLSFPFVFDDHIYLVDNPLMKDIHSFAWMGDFTKFANYSKSLDLDPDISTNMILRPVTYLTFYFNYLIDGMNPRGFRAVNIVIHCANAMLLLFMVSRILRMSGKRGTRSGFSADFIALSAALMFLVHPLQIESVTYIVQRFTSLGTLFYLVTILTFLKANHSENSPAARWWRAASVASLIVGMLTKEFLFTAPFMLILLDWLVMGTPVKVACQRTLPHLFCLPIIPVLIMFTAAAQNDGSPGLSATLNITNGAGYAPAHYALTQLSVVLTYLRLIFIPVGLNLDWDYPLSTSLLQGSALMSALVIAGILGGLWYWYRQRGQDVRHALLCYAVLWFFMTLAIDSSIVPLPDLMAEHRAYLPSIGILCALACGADLLRTERCNRRRLRYLIPALILIWIMTLATATNLRHQVWRSEISIWKDIAAKSPRKFRPLFNLATAYFEKGQPQEAAACIRKAIPLSPQCFVAYRNLGRVENSLGRHREALEALRIGVWLAPDDHEQHHELGLAYAGLGDVKQSKIEFMKAISLRPSYRPTHLALGALYVNLQQYDKALEQLRIAATLQPLDPTQRQLANQLAQLAAQQRRNSP